jgi:hypothetical protein
MSLVYETAEDGAAILELTFLEKRKAAFTGH